MWGPGRIGGGTDRDKEGMGEKAAGSRGERKSGLWGCEGLGLNLAPEMLAGGKVGPLPLRSALLQRATHLSPWLTAAPPDLTRLNLAPPGGSHTTPPSGAPSLSGMPHWSSWPLPFSLHPRGEIYTKIII